MSKSWKQYTIKLKYMLFHEAPCRKVQSLVLTPPSPLHASFPSLAIIFDFSHFFVVASEFLQKQFWNTALES